MRIEEHLAELGGEGYCKTSQNFLYYLQRHPDIRHNLFRFSGMASMRGGAKYSSFDMFGRKLVYYVLDCDEARKKFSEYLVGLLKEKNPNPDRHLKKAFTHLLHNNNLHSELCYEKLHGRSASVSSLQIFD